MKIKHRIQEYLKNIARHILQDELLELHNQIIDVTEQKRTWKNRYLSITQKRATIPVSALLLIEKLLPDANQFANGNLTINDLCKEELEIKNKEGGIIRGRIHEISKNSITIEITNWNTKIKIPISFQNLDFGHGLITETYVWDLLNSNIGGLLDSRATFSIRSFITALNNLDENDE